MFHYFGAYWNQLGKHTSIIIFQWPKQNCLLCSRFIDICLFTAFSIRLDLDHRIILSYLTCRAARVYMRVCTFKQNLIPSERARARRQHRVASAALKQPQYDHLGKVCLYSTSKSCRSLKPQPYCISPRGQTELATLWNEASEIWLFKSSSYELDCCARRSGLSFR